MMVRAGSQSTFKDGQADLKVYAAINVSAESVERIAEIIDQETEVWSMEERKQVLAQRSSMHAVKTIPVLYLCYDGIGVPMTRIELVGRKGKQADGSALTREAKLGCFFAQTTTDERGFPVRELASTSFVGSIESSDDFGWRTYAQTVRRGLYRAKQVVILEDAAEWIGSIKEEHFPGAIQIVDLYHARKHVSENGVFFRLRDHGSRLQNSHMNADVTVRHGMVSTRRKRHYLPPLRDEIWQA